MVLKVFVLAAYAAMIIWIGIAGFRKARSFSDYFLGGGTVGAWMTAFTYGTAYFSAVMFIGFAGRVGWGFGLSGLWIAAGNTLVGVLLVWWLLGPKIRRMSREYGVHTIGEYFEKRYESPFFKLYASICIFVFFIPYSAAVFMGLSYLFRSTFGIDYTLALILMGGFTALYLVLGGYKSITVIDMVFGIIMLLGVGVMLWSILEQGKGLGTIVSGIASIDPKLASPVGPPGWWPLFSLVFLTSVAPLAMPQLVQKFYAIRDDRAIRVGMVGSTVFALIVTGIGYFAGATTRYFLSSENAPMAFADGAPIYDALMPELLTRVIPEALSVLILLLILSASMSTLAALVLISSSAVAKDFYAGFVNRTVSDSALTKLMRTGSAAIVILSVVMAYYRPATIVSILGISWGAIGAAFLGPFLWGLCGRRANRIGALGSSLTGLAVCLTLYMTGTASPQAGTLGMIVSLALTPLLSALVPTRQA
ncbi:MAG: sodium:solute symporter [candidate division Zixibacteria bacterium]|jgi:SSS family solute:Na+ symporter/sodium/proline symporter|nr:sodium:solute symporter [candidate division Zixibacteria bacterium]